MKITFCDKVVLKASLIKGNKCNFHSIGAAFVFQISLKTAGRPRDLWLHQAPYLFNFYIPHFKTPQLKLPKATACLHDGHQCDPESQKPVKLIKYLWDTTFSHYLGQMHDRNAKKNILHTVNPLLEVDLVLFQILNSLDLYQRYFKNHNFQSKVFYLKQLIKVQMG